MCRKPGFSILRRSWRWCRAEAAVLSFLSTICLLNLPKSNTNISNPCWKAVVEVQPKNVLVYVTSNRRNLVKETWTDRNSPGRRNFRSGRYSGASVSGRPLRLTITFYAPDKELYTEIVRSLAEREGWIPTVSSSSRRLTNGICARPVVPDVPQSSLSRIFPAFIRREKSNFEKNNGRIEIVAEITCEAAGRTEDRPSLAAGRRNRKSGKKLCFIGV